MPTKKNTTIPPDKIELYRKAIATVPNIEIKGATMPYTSHNGHMFSFLDKDGRLGLRLPKQERDEFLAKYNTTLCEAHGTVLKEYALVPDILFINTKEMKKHLTISFNYVNNLKSKK